MNAQELPERKDKAVTHLRNAIFMWWVKVMDFYFLSDTFLQQCEDLWAFSLLLTAFS